MRRIGGVWVCSVAIIFGSHLIAAPTSDSNASYVGATGCSSSSCHGGTTRGTDEFTLWSTEDKHAKAYGVLFLPKSQRMAALLGQGKAPESQFCLDCHAVSVPVAKRGPKYDLQDGVGCEGCHGAAGAWLEPHTRKGWTHGKNVALGLYDNQDLAKRTENCVRCHTGLAHKVYAAGHPEITFELDTFSALMPRHWQEEGPSGRIWALGQAIYLRETLKGFEKRVKERQALDEGDMRCATCHHNLYDVRWELNASSNGQPGWDPAHWAIFRHLVALAFPAEASSLEAAFQKIAEAFRRGEAEGTPEATERIIATLEKLIPQIQAFKFNQDLIRQLVLRIAADDTYFTSGFRVAEQGVLAIAALLPTAQTKPLFDALDVNDPARYDVKKFIATLTRFGRKFSGTPFPPCAQLIPCTPSEKP